MHFELHYFVQCHVIHGANNNCKLPLNVNRSHTSILVEIVEITTCYKLVTIRCTLNYIILCNVM